MANARRDENRITTLTGVLNTNGTTIVNVKSGAATHAVKAVDASTGSDLGPTDAKIDENHVPTMLAVSADDGVTVVPVYVDVDGNLLVDSN